MRRVLLNELERESQASSRVEREMAIVRALRERAAAGKGKPADKSYIDGLYERE